MYKHLLLVFLGGGLGSVIRFSIGKLLQFYQLNTNFPWATFSVNIIGSFLIGLLLALEFKMGDNFSMIKSFLIIGFCGGFTTFSSFAFENFYLIKEGQLGLFLTYAFTSLLLGILAVYTGWMLKS